MRSTVRAIAYAAAPIFLLMAVATIAFGETSICSATHQALTPMSQMYLLMTAFHASPWLKLFHQRANRRSVRLSGQSFVDARSRDAKILT